MTSRPTHAIGVDVGGTKTAAAIVDLGNGDLIEHSVIPTGADRDGESVLSDVTNLISVVIETADRNGLILSGTGIGVAELVDLEGVVRSSQTLDWDGYDIAARSGLAGRIVVESDVRAGAIADARFGAGVDRTSFLYVSVGTGVSTTLVINGRPWRGTHGNAIIAATGPLAFRCGHCGREQLFVPEEVASGAGMENAYANRSSQSQQSANAIIQLAEEGDELAVSIVHDASAALASVIGQTINLVDPECVIVGGGLGTATGQYWDTFTDRVERHLVARQSRDIPIFQSPLGRHGPLIGAALSVVEL